MKVQDMIAKLEGEGFKVKFFTERATPEAVTRCLQDREAHGYLHAPPLETLSRRVMTDAGLSLSPKGGKTTAVIFKGETKLVEGIALCSPLDHFNKHEGRIKALGRAISELRSKT